MDAFYYANHTTQAFDSVSTPGFRVAGELRLDPGSYVVFAKLSAGVNVATGYPPPAWPYAGGAAFLSLAGARDVAFVSAKPESAENNDTLTLTVAREISGSRTVRLYYLATYPLRTFLNHIRIIALKVDRLSVVEVGTDHTTVPRDLDEIVREQMLNPKWWLLSDLVKLPDSDDD